MMALIITIHAIVCALLIIVILIQAGRGGGLSESFGGSSTQTILGTKSSVFLKRATAVSAVMYILVCLLLGVMTSHRGRSLVAKGGALQAPLTTSGGYPQAPNESPLSDF